LKQAPERAKPCKPCRIVVALTFGFANLPLDWRRRYSTCSFLGSWAPALSTLVIFAGIKANAKNSDNTD
jgi:hypothetical protein